MGFNGTLSTQRRAFAPLQIGMHCFLGFSKVISDLGSETSTLPNNVYLLVNLQLSIVINVRVWNQVCIWQISSGRRLVKSLLLQLSIKLLVHVQLLIVKSLVSLFLVRFILEYECKFVMADTNAWKTYFLVITIVKSCHCEHIPSEITRKSNIPFACFT